MTIEEAYNDAMKNGLLKESRTLENFKEAMADESQRYEFWKHSQKYHPGFYSKDYKKFSLHVAKSLRESETPTVSQEIREEVKVNEPSSDFSSLLPDYTGSRTLRELQEVDEKAAQLKRERESSDNLTPEERQAQQNVESQVAQRELENANTWVNQERDKKSIYEPGFKQSTPFPERTTPEDYRRQLQQGMPAYLTRKNDSELNIALNIADAWFANSDEGKKVWSTAESDVATYSRATEQELEEYAVALQNDINSGKITLEQAKKQIADKVKEANADIDEYSNKRQMEAYEAAIEANKDRFNWQLRQLGIQRTDESVDDWKRRFSQKITETSERYAVLKASSKKAQQEYLEEYARDRRYGHGALREQREASYGKTDVEGKKKAWDEAYGRQHSANHEDMLYSIAQRFIDRSEELSAAVRQGKGWGAGFAEGITDISNWDFGISDIIGTYNLDKLIEKNKKWEKEHKSEDKLTDAEQALLDAASIYAMSQAYNADLLSHWYKAGQSTAASVPYMLQFAVMPLDAISNSTAKGLLRLSMKVMPKSTIGYKGFGRATKIHLAKLAGTLTAATTQTFTFNTGRIAADYMQGRTGKIVADFDENGIVKFKGTEGAKKKGTALKDAVVTNFNENFFEIYLGSLSPFTKFAETSKLFKGMKRSDIGIAIRDVMNSGVGRAAKRSQWNGIAFEDLEENLTNLSNWAFVSDYSKDAKGLRDAGFNLDDQIDTFLALAPTSILFGVGGLASYYGPLAVDAAKLRANLATEAEKKMFDAIMRESRSGDFGLKAHDLVRSIVTNSEYTPEGKRTMLETVFAKYHGQVAADTRKVVADLAEERYGKLFDESNLSNKVDNAIYFGEDASGKGFFITDGRVVTKQVDGQTVVDTQESDKEFGIRYIRPDGSFMDEIKVKNDVTFGGIDASTIAQQRKEFVERGKAIILGKSMYSNGEDTFDVETNERLTPKEVEQRRAAEETPTVKDEELPEGIAPIDTKERHIQKDTEISVPLRDKNGNVYDYEDIMFMSAGHYLNSDGSINIYDENGEIDKKKLDLIQIHRESGTRVSDTKEKVRFIELLNERLRGERYAEIQAARKAQTEKEEKAKKENTEEARKEEERKPLEQQKEAFRKSIPMKKNGTLDTNNATPEQIFFFNLEKYGEAEAIKRAVAQIVWDEQHKVELQEKKGLMPQDRDAQMDESQDRIDGYYAAIQKWAGTKASKNVRAEVDKALGVNQEQETQEPVAQETVAPEQQVTQEQPAPQEAPITPELPVEVAPEKSAEPKAKEIKKQKTEKAEKPVKEQKQQEPEQPVEQEVAKPVRSARKARGYEEGMDVFAPDVYLVRDASNKISLVKADKMPANAVKKQRIYLDATGQTPFLLWSYAPISSTRGNIKYVDQDGNIQEIARASAFMEQVVDNQTKKIVPVPTPQRKNVTSFDTILKAKMRIEGEEYTFEDFLKAKSVGSTKKQGGEGEKYLNGYQVVAQHIDARNDLTDEQKERAKEEVRRQINDWIDAWNSLAQNKLSTATGLKDKDLMPGYAMNLSIYRDVRDKHAKAGEIEDVNAIQAKMLNMDFRVSKATDTNLRRDNFFNPLYQLTLMVDIAQKAGLLSKEESVETSLPASLQRIANSEVILPKDIEAARKIYAKEKAQKHKTGALEDEFPEVLNNLPALVRFAQPKNEGRVRSQSNKWYDKELGEVYQAMAAKLQISEEEKKAAEELNNFKNMLNQAYVLATLENVDEETLAQMNDAVQAELDKHTDNPEYKKAFERMQKRVTKHVNNLEKNKEAVRRADLLQARRELEKERQDLIKKRDAANKRDDEREKKGEKREEHYDVLKLDGDIKEVEKRIANLETKNSWLADEFRISQEVAVLQELNKQLEKQNKIMDDIRANRVEHPVEADRNAEREQNNILTELLEQISDYEAEHPEARDRFYKMWNEANKKGLSLEVQPEFQTGEENVPMAEFTETEKKSKQARLAYNALVAALQRVKGLNLHMVGSQKASRAVLVDLLKSVSHKPEFMIIGEWGTRGIDNFNRNEYLQDALYKAQVLEEEGESIEKIRLATGWERGADNKWRYELPDFELNIDEIKKHTELLAHDAVLHIPGSKLLKVNKAFQEFRKAYGEWALDTSMIQFRIYSAEGSTHGSFIEPIIDEKTGIVVEPAIIKLNAFYGFEEMQKTLIHEMQHYIQHKEGFAKGGSIEWSRRLREKIENIRVFVSKRMIKIGYILGHGVYLKQNDQRFQDIYDFQKAIGFSYPAEWAYLDYLVRTGEIDEGTHDEYRQMLRDCDEQVKDIMSKYISKAGINFFDAFGKDADARWYLALAGEVEARNVEERMYMSDEERRNTPLAKTEDIDRDAQIIAEVDGQTTKVEFFRAKDGTIYGWSIGNDMYLTDEGLNPETPIHEYTHIWLNALKVGNKAAYDKVLRAIKARKGLWEKITKDPAYAHLTTDEEIASEVLARYSGKRGAARLMEVANELYGQNPDAEPTTLTKTFISKMQSILKEFWDAVKGLFGIQSMDDISDWVLKDLFDGKPLDFNTEEMQAIKEKAKADGTFMKAPNGRPTKLTEKQWLQVRTKAFKEWYGDWENPKEGEFFLLDENGEPMVVFHGTEEAGFDIFVPQENGERNGRGIFMTPQRFVAGVYGRLTGEENGEYEATIGKDAHRGIYSLFANIKNPLIVDCFDQDTQKPSMWDKIPTGIWKIVGQNIETRYYDSYEAAVADYYEQGWGIGTEGTDLEEPEIVPETFTTDEFVEMARAQGYDGVIFRNIIDGTDSSLLEDTEDNDLYMRAHDVVTALAPNQVKSATQNNGLFSMEDARIEYSVAQKKAENADTKQYNDAHKAMRDAIAAQGDKNLKREQKIPFIEKAINKMLDRTESIRRLMEFINAYRKMNGMQPIDDKHDIRTLIESADSRIVNESDLLNNGLAAEFTDSWRELCKKIEKSEFYKTYSQEITPYGDPNQKRRYVTKLTPMQLLERYMMAVDNIEYRFDAKKERGLVELAQRLTGKHVDEEVSREDALYFAQQFVNAFEAEFGKREDAKSEVAKFWDLVKQMTDYALDKSLESKNISKEKYDELKAKRYYVPQRGNFHEDEESDTPKDVELTRQGRGITLDSMRKAEGAKSLGCAPIAHILRDAEEAITKGELNKVKLAMFELLRDNAAWAKENGIETKRVYFKLVEKEKNGKKVLEPERVTENDEEYVKATTEELNAQIAELEEKLPKALSDEEEELIRDEINKRIVQLNYSLTESETRRLYNAYFNAGVEVPLIIEGVQSEIKFPPRYQYAAYALNGITNPKGQSEIFKMAMGWLSAQFTVNNIAFPVVNLTRDIAFVIPKGAAEYGPLFPVYFARNFVMSQKVVARYAFGKNSLWMGKAFTPQAEVGTKAYIGNYATEFRKFLEEGGNTGYSNLPNIQQFMSHVRDLAPGMRFQDLSGKEKLGKVLRGVGKGLGIFEMRPLANCINEWSELITRFAIYKSIVDMELGRNEAVKAAHNLSVNFNRKAFGTLITNMFNTLSVFANAAIQGSSGFWRTFYKASDSKKEKTIHAINAARTMMAWPMILGFFDALMNPDDGEDFYVTDYDRDNYAIFGNIRIPLNEQLKPFWGIGVNAALVATHRRSWPDALNSVLNTTLRGLIPVAPNVIDATIAGLDKEGNFGDFAETLFMPAFLQSFSQIAHNENFMGSPIRYDFEKKMPQYLLSPNEPWIFKEIAYLAYTKEGRTDLNVGERRDVGSAYKGPDDDYERISRTWDINPKELREYTFFIPRGTVEMIGLLAAITHDAVSGNKFGTSWDMRNVPIANRMYREENTDAYRNNVRKEGEALYEKLKEPMESLLDAAKANGFYAEKDRSEGEYQLAAQDEQKVRDIEQEIENWYGNTMRGATMKTLEILLNGLKEVNMRKRAKSLGLPDESVMEDWMVMTDLKTLEDLEKAEREICEAIDFVTKSYNGLHPCKENEYCAEIVKEFRKIDKDANAVRYFERRK